MQKQYTYIYISRPFKTYPHALQIVKMMNDKNRKQSSVKAFGHTQTMDIHMQVLVKFSMKFF